jgi:carboxymethylenebutenolidase
MNSITTSTIDIPIASGIMSAYLATPKDYKPTTPSIIIPMHLFGVDEAMRQAGNRFADAGYITIVPDLYWRVVSPSGDGRDDAGAFIPFAQRLQPADIDADLAAAVDCLHDLAMQTRIGIAGFCMGGKIALRRCIDSGSFHAGAIWYGSIDGVSPADIGVPLIGSFGAEDTHLPVDAIRTFWEALPVAKSLTIYEGAGHAFCDGTRRTYEAVAAESSWRRVLEFFNRFLPVTGTA